jgi:hypothetical protein
MTTDPIDPNVEYVVDAATRFIVGVAATLHHRHDPAVVRAYVRGTLVYLAMEANRRGCSDLIDDLIDDLAYAAEDRHGT